MASQELCDVNVIIVVPRGCSSSNDCSNDMWECYNACCNYDIQVVWRKEEECLKGTPGKKDVFIMEKFEGPVFEELQKFKCSIVGPRCLISCFLTGEEIPGVQNPVFSTAMRKQVICVSGFTNKEKEKFRRLVEYMGGTFTRELRDSVTCLVTNSVLSKKYEVVSKKDRLIMTGEWIEAVWEANLKEFVHATDERFHRYKCPIFKGLVATSSNFSKSQKEDIRRNIIENGGTYMAALDGSKVNLVLVPENPRPSEKLKFAFGQNITCVNTKWLYDSVKVGYALPSSNYVVVSTKASSTPEKSNASASLNFSGISVLADDRETREMMINETVNSTGISTTGVSNITQRSPERNDASFYLRTLARLHVSQAEAAGPFLDGCNIYLAGFQAAHREKLTRILNLGSATRLDEISAAVTHLIVGDRGKASQELKVLRAKGLNPHLLKLDWLEESMKLRKAAPEEAFLYYEESGNAENNPEPPSPLSKKNLQLLHRPRKPPVPSFELNQNATPKPDEAPDFLHQYLQKNPLPAEETTLRDILKDKSKDHSEEATTQLGTKAADKSKNVTTRITGKFAEALEDDALSMTTQESLLNQSLFDGLTFIVTGFLPDEDDDPVKQILIHGGKVVPSTFPGIPDYGVVPVFGAPLKHAVNEIVTNLFIDDCINNNAVMDVLYYHRPLSIPGDAKPLEDCVVVISSYTGCERTYLSTLCKHLGAIYQDILARKTNKENNLFACTHLICPLPEGVKYKAAVKWKLPAVTRDWLVSCASELQLVSETPYLVGDTMAPERQNKSLSYLERKAAKDSADETMKAPPERVHPTNSVTRQIITPKRHLPDLQHKDTPSPHTPLINMRLSGDFKTPPSPFHVSTPETPYGEVFKPNPSPATRKAWVKWIEGSNWDVEEPPPKRKSVGTPLEVLQERLMKGLVRGGLGLNDSDSSPATAANTRENLRRNLDLPEDPIQRKLDYEEEFEKQREEEMEREHREKVNSKLAQLEMHMRRNSNLLERRYSSGDNINPEYIEPDIMHKCPESQPDTQEVCWEQPPIRPPVRSVDENLPEEDEEGRESNKKEEREVKEDEEKEEEELSRKEPQPIRRKFMLSGIKERAPYEEIICNLGGEVSKDATFDVTATHLLCIRPLRNEKLMGSIASGKWVLHCNYLRDSQEASEFLEEELYEWGNPRSRGNIPDPANDTERVFAEAAFRWRSKFTTEGRVAAFEGMVASLLVAKDKVEQYERLIQAGGGTVAAAKPPYDTSPKGKRITHCFIQSKSVDNQHVDWAMMASKGILCFQPQYLGDILTLKPPYDPKNYVIPEFKKYLSLLPRSSKSWEE